MAEPMAPVAIPTTPLRRAWSAVLLAGLGFGLAANLLLRAPGEAGLNLLLLSVGLAVAMGVVARQGGIRLSGEALAWMATSVLLGATFVFRGAPPLHGVAFLAAAAALSMPGLRAGGRWIRGSGVGDQGEALVGAVLYSGLGILRLVHRPGRAGFSPPVAGTGGDEEGTWGGEPGRNPILGVLQGVLLALPLLLVFGALFMSADAVFAELVTRALGALDPELLASHLLVTAVLGWMASGFLVGFLSGTRLRDWIPAGVPRPTLGILQVGTVVALVDLLFAAFVMVQIRYLFGGSGVVELTPGLTYAAYAREGFVQLLLATALVLPTLLLADWLLRQATPRARRTFRLLGGLQLLLLLVVIASAIQRVRVYQVAYGLTESRFYGGVFLVWLTFVAIWFAITVLRGRRTRFAPVALLSLYLAVAGLIVANPDERIARANLARVGLPTSGSFDAAYLGSLGADAVPTLVDALPRLPWKEKCTLARALGRRWGAEAPGDWRNWNLPRSRARTLVSHGMAPWLAGCPMETRG